MAATCTCRAAVLAPRAESHRDPFCRQAGPEAEEDGAHPQGAHRLLLNQRHGEQEEVPGQQPVRPHPERPGQTQDRGGEEAGGRQR